LNRYSMFFAALVAASFVTHPASAPESAGEERVVEAGLAKAKAESPESFLGEFLAKAQLAPKQNPDLQMLFATVPHPFETHLASAFDHNVDAMQDGLQDAGYLFDSSYIPWDAHLPRDAFDDDQKERIAKAQEDQTPGILLFRKRLANERYGSPTDSYSGGIVVFLITEKPTEGISLDQARAAIDILGKAGIPFTGLVRILGPTYSGSFASLVSVAELLHGKNPAGAIEMRSGGITGGRAALATTAEIETRLPGTHVAFGSAQHDFSDFDRLAERTLSRFGIGAGQIAFLSEQESSFGWYTQELLGNYGHASWNISFPRDISSLRADYERQGILDAYSAAQPWKRSLTLKSDAQSSGDSVRSFGGSDTVAAQESVLFGISDFLKTHSIRAVIISATNEEDRYFLAQFLHAHNSNIRIVVFGNTRLFMRGVTAQFRGDLVVDSFPMLPRLHDWTRGWLRPGMQDAAARIFADSVSEGTYFAALDLFAEPHEIGPATSQSAAQFKWYSEYSAPNWNPAVTPLARPPMWIVGLGSNSTWPIADDAESAMLSGNKDAWHGKMPFTLFDRRQAPTEKPPLAAQIHVSRFWKVLFWFVIAVTVIYAICFWVANPVERGALATFEPMPKWRYWVFKVAIPAAVAGCAFRVLAWSVEIPGAASADAVIWWHGCEVLTVLAPLAIASAAVVKAIGPVQLGWSRRKLIPFVPGAIALLALLPSGIFRGNPFAGRDLGSVLNSYREMHWESGLSLLPTALLFLLAIFIWASQAGNGAAFFAYALKLPDFPGNPRISKKYAKVIASVGRPIPLTREAFWLWGVWFLATIVIYIGCFRFHPFAEITTLESINTTHLVFIFSAAVTSLIVLDMLQFLWLWDRLKDLLMALDRQEFKRSFVPIQDFNWRKLWSFGGVSLRDRRAIDDAQIACIHGLAYRHGLTGLRPSADTLQQLRDRYNRIPLAVDRPRYRNNHRLFFDILVQVGTGVAWLVANPSYLDPPAEIRPDVDAIQRALAGRKEEGRFDDEGGEVARLPEWQAAAERLLCLMYVGFLHTVVARLHSLLISVSAMFSLMVLGLAIYPFLPFSPLLLFGLSLLALIGWAFFKVFSEMDTDPILARIVNGDDRKLQGNFYMKFAESLALPMLTLASSLLPGGAGRLIELAQTLVNHGQ